MKCTTQPNKCSRCQKECVEFTEVSKERSRGIWPVIGDAHYLCPGCYSGFKEQEKKKIRNLRREKKALYTKKYEAIIPPLFRNARLNHLGSKFKKNLLNYNKNTGCVLCGLVGTGKSYSICALLRYMASIKDNKNKTFDRISYEILTMKIRDAFKPTSKKSEYEIIKPYICIDYLAIEDLGSTRPIGSIESEFSLRVFYAILDSRLEQCKPTFITTNKTLDNLKVSFDERIASRLSCMTWIGVGGEDKRKRGSE